MTVKIGHCHRYLLSTTFGKWNLFEGRRLSFHRKDHVHERIKDTARKTIDDEVCERANH